MGRARRNGGGCHRGRHLGDSVPVGRCPGSRGRVGDPEGRGGASAFAGRHFAGEVRGLRRGGPYLQASAGTGSCSEHAWYNLGVLAQQDGRTADARAAYDKALRIDPSFTSALFNQALLLKSSEPDRALTLLKRAVAANPKAATAHLHIGNILAKKDRDEEAEASFRRAVAADSSLHSQLPESFKDSVSPSPSPTSRQAGTR
ncbi:tetratricopeptide repeat protein [Streptomyces sp. V4I23]|uniref:tetratricopeptide repeat protein n=1 Tax=Streptomyces sp. V4I23 TaxID=3042282 RepID=UPI00358EC551